MAGSLVCLMNRRNVQREHVVVLLNAVLELHEEGVILVRAGDDEIGDVPRIAFANVFDTKSGTRSKTVAVVAGQQVFKFATGSNSSLTPFAIIYADTCRHEEVLVVVHTDSR